MVKSNRRKFSRFVCEGRVTIATTDEQRNSRLIDLSLKGALIERPADWELPIGEALDLDIHLEASPAPIHMVASVAHVDSRTMGMRCERIDLDSITTLKRLVEINLGDATLLERELQALGT